MTHSNASTYLNSFIDFEKNLAAVDRQAFKLERMFALCEALGNPQKDLNVIHVAGSKGKGSTAVMTAHVLKEAGYRTGLYTSPHMNHLRERIRILDKEDQRCCENDIFVDNITEEELHKLIEPNKEVIEQLRQTDEYGRLTFYEVLTALSFLFFKEQKCDWVILETGLGGRLDATNVCRAKLAVITLISLEHTHILGETIEQIAKEKSGIIKGGEEVVIALQSDEAMQVIRNRCFEFDIEPRIIDLNEEEAALVLKILRQKFPLKGEHQANNVLTVLEVTAALTELDVALDDDQILNGLKQVYWPIRFEQICDQPILILDGAHDTASMQALALTLEQEFPGYRVRCLFGLGEEKNHKAITQIIDQFAQTIVATKADHPRAHTFDAQELESYFPGKAVFAMDSIAKALSFILSTAAKDELIVVTGSLFVAAQARQHFLSCLKT